MIPKQKADEAIIQNPGKRQPQGKPRVYFTGHPEDLGPYFDEITDDIMKT